MMSSHSCVVSVLCILSENAYNNHKKKSFAPGVNTEHFRVVDIHFCSAFNQVTE